MLGKVKKLIGKVKKCFTNVNKVTTTGGTLVSYSGEVLVGGILQSTGFYKSINALDNLHQGAKFSNSSILAYGVATACRGNADFAGIEDYQEAPDFYAGVFNGPIPSEPTYRQRLGELAETPVVERTLWDWNAQSLLKVPIISADHGFYNLDFDVTPTDEGFKVHKEGLGNTYKRTNGYAPMVAYLGQEQYIIKAELRPGIQHSQKGTAQFLADTIDYAVGIVPRNQILVRMDSGNDAVENFGVCLDKGVFFLIKGNRRKMTAESLLEHAKKYTLPEKIARPREGKTIYIGSTWKKFEYTSLMDGEKKEIVLRMVYEVTERTSDAVTGQLRLVPDIEANIWWTNTGISDEEVIERYHSHGSIEQGHSEVKSDADFNKLPSQTYTTNCLMFTLGCLGYNIDHMIGMEMYADSKDCPLRKPAYRRRVKTVIKHIINMPGRIINSGNMTMLDLGRGALKWGAMFKYMFLIFCRS